MLEDQRNGLKLSGHFQPATSLLSSPPSGSSFQPATLPALFSGYFIIPASGVQHNIVPSQARRAVLVQKRTTEIIWHRGRDGCSSVCLSSGGLCSPRAKVTHFSLRHVTPAHPMIPAAFGSIQPSIFQLLNSQLPYRPAVLHRTRCPVFPRLLQVRVFGMQLYSA